PGQQLELRLNYRPELFDRETVDAFAAGLVRLLAGAVGDPQRAIGSLEILSGAERRRIVEEWNATEQAVPAANLADLFSEQARARPAAPAVVFGDAELSYGELEVRSNQLAHHLRALGVGPEVIVGLCLERSLDLVVGLLGILKAGGAYLPLDPDYPRERLGFMLADAGARVLITDTASAEGIAGYDGV